MSSSSSTMMGCPQPLKIDNCDEVEYFFMRKINIFLATWKSKRKFKSCSLRAVKVLKGICNFSSCESFPIICVLYERILFHFSRQIHLFMADIVHHSLRQRPQIWDKERRVNFSWKSCCYDKIMKSRLIEFRDCQAIKNELLDPLIIC